MANLERAWGSILILNAAAPISWEQNCPAVLDTVLSSAGTSGARATFGLKNAWARARAHAIEMALSVYKITILFEDVFDCFNKHCITVNDTEFMDLFELLHGDCFGSVYFADFLQIVAPCLLVVHDWSGIVDPDLDLNERMSSRILQRRN